MCMAAHLVENHHTCCQKYCHQSSLLLRISKCTHQQKPSTRELYTQATAKSRSLLITIFEKIWQVRGTHQNLDNLFLSWKKLHCRHYASTETRYGWNSMWKFRPPTFWTVSKLAHFHAPRTSLPNPRTYAPQLPRAFRVFLLWQSFLTTDVILFEELHDVLFYKNITPMIFSEAWRSP